MKRLWHAALASVVLLALLIGPDRGANASAISQAQPGSRPNIIVILTDDQDLRLGSLDVMPNLQSLLAARGMTFSNFFAPLPLCCPARATLLTGQYSHNNRILWNLPPLGGFQKFFDLGLEETTIATALDEAGYNTVLLGKYLNGYPSPEDQTHIPPGWDEWYAPVTDSAYSSYDYVMNENGELVTYGAEPDAYITDVLTDKAIDFIQRSVASAPETPFFVQLGIYAPHSPAEPAPRHKTLFPDAQVPRDPSFNESDMSDKPPFMQNLALLTESQIAGMDTLRRKQLQSLQAVDEAIGALVTTLEQTGQLDNTYILFLSDNGLHMGQHRFETGKGTPFEEDIHVPLIVRGPGIPEGVVRDELASLVDIVPTLAELGQATMPIPVDGRSLVPLLMDTAPPESWRQALLIEHWRPPNLSEGETNEALALEPPDDYERQLQEMGLSEPDYLVLRTAEYKYVDRAGPAMELYDIADDRYELYSQHADVAPEFLAQLDAWLGVLKNCAGDACRNSEAMTPPAWSLRFDRADIDRSGQVDAADVEQTSACWNQPVVDTCGDRYDLDYDGAIDVADILAVVGAQK